MDANDTHYAPALGRYARVFVNGFEQKTCITADEERGYVVRLRQPLGVNHKGNLRTERVYGNVCIGLRADTPGVGKEQLVCGRERMTFPRYILNTIQQAVKEALNEENCWQTCLHCKHFDEDNGELCKIAVPPSRPPARVITFGCPAFVDDRHD